MEYRALGTTDIKVSLICLGTMTWGEQNSEAEGHAQMDYAVEQGVNFFDTAEMYAVPPKAETQGRTEEITGTWFRKSGKRKDIILATKVVGPAPGFPWIREGKTGLDRANIMTAVEGSLKRLGTDYIDLYQIHWPQRPVNSFGRLGFDARVTGEESDQILESLRVMDELVKSGKVRTIGLSNETPWGVMTFLKHHAVHGLPRVASIQNPYNFLNRTFEVGLAEMAIQEKVGLLAYSPIAGGVLSGKYLNGQMPAGSRRAIDTKRKSRYSRPREEETVSAYVGVAKKHGLDPVQMALAYVNTRPFLTSNIIGSTTMEQLKTDIASLDVKLSPDVLADIEAVHDVSPNPCP